MRSEQRIFKDGAWQSEATLTEAQLVLAFGSGVAFDPAQLQQVRATYPRAHVVGCTTAGEISGATIADGTLVTTALFFETSSVQVASAVLARGAAELTGFQLADRLPKPGLKHVLVLSNGIGVNGAALARGMRELLPPGVALSGGLAADERLEHTQVVLDDYLCTTTVAAVGFYGEQLQVTHRSLGGFKPFGPERRVTKSEGNVVIELDSEPALTLYRRYLGTRGAVLRFPLAMPGGATRVVVGVDEAKGTLTFDGDVPQGTYARLMRGSRGTLVGDLKPAPADEHPSFAFVVSCVGRRLSMHQRAEEELEALSAGGAQMAGFYALSSLDDHTLNLTTFAEV